MNIYVIHSRLIGTYEGRIVAIGMEGCSYYLLPVRFLFNYMAFARTRSAIEYLLEGTIFF